MPTKIADVARHARVSTATVSRVLSGKPHVSEPIRLRVLQAVEELGYRPSRVAASLRSQRAKIIGIIVSDIQNPFFTSIVRGVEDVASQHSYGVFLCNSDEDPAKEALYVETLLAEQVSGVIVAPTASATHLYARLLDVQIPVVAVDRRASELDLDTVVIDNVLAARQLVEQLISAGHKRIGAITGSLTVTTGLERQIGYEMALDAFGLARDPDLIRTGLPKVDVGYRLMVDLLNLPVPPTAVFTGNNLLTVGALRALHERGLRVGHDLDLAAFDEMDWMFVLSPPPLVVSQPTYQMGQHAAELLFQRMLKFDQPTREIVLIPDIHYAH